MKLFKLKKKFIIIQTCFLITTFSGCFYACTKSCSCYKHCTVIRYQVFPQPEPKLKTYCTDSWLEFCSSYFYLCV